MVLVGGITRLTESGLSITEWKPISGIVPPITTAQWQTEFSKYQQSPEYLFKNSSMDLSEFKFIFFWEYIHRLIGRIIGLVFIFPFIYFKLSGQFSKQFTLKLWGVFVLGAFQGLLGWYMVASGLVNKPDVSHFRLAAHLITAFITCAYIFWLALELIFPPENIKTQKKKLLSITLLVAIAIQIIYGAFVAGLDAGKIYNTYPKMGEKWIADAVYAYPVWWQNITENPAGVQFIHRTLALLIALLIALNLKGKNKGSKTKQAANIMLGLVLLQVLLGICTLLYAVPLWLGVLHQLGAFALFLAAVYNLYISRFSSAYAAPLLP